MYLFGREGFSDLYGCTCQAQGTRLLFYNTDSDILLLAVPGAIPDHYEAYHLGFDASMNAVPLSAVVIHHPDGSPKSISYVNSRCAAATVAVCITPRH